MLGCWLTFMNHTEIWWNTAQQSDPFNFTMQLSYMVKLNGSNCWAVFHHISWWFRNVKLSNLIFINRPHFGYKTRGHIIHRFFSSFFLSYLLPFFLLVFVLQKKPTHIMMETKINLWNAAPLEFWKTKCCNLYMSWELTN